MNLLKCVQSAIAKQTPNCNVAIVITIRNYTHILWMVHYLVYKVLI